MIYPISASTLRIKSNNKFSNPVNFTYHNSPTADTVSFKKLQESKEPSEVQLKSYTASAEKLIKEVDSQIRRELPSVDKEILPFLSISKKQVEKVKKLAQKRYLDFSKPLEERDEKGNLTRRTTFYHGLTSFKVEEFVKGRETPFRTTVLDERGRFDNYTYTEYSKKTQKCIRDLEVSVWNDDTPFLVKKFNTYNSHGMPIYQTAAWNQMFNLESGKIKAEDIERVDSGYQGSTASKDQRLFHQSLVKFNEFGIPIFVSNGDLGKVLYCIKFDPKTGLPTASAMYENDGKYLLPTSVTKTPNGDDKSENCASATIVDGKLFEYAVNQKDKNIKYDLSEK